MWCCVMRDAEEVIGAVAYHMELDVKSMMAIDELMADGIIGHHIYIWYHEIFNSLKPLWYQSASVSLQR